MAVAIGTDSRGGASPSAPPPTWRGFASVDEYKAFLKDPGRIVRLEWRKVALHKHRGLVSHSWLLAYLFDSRCLRLELFADSGLTEKILLAGGDRAGATLYENRAAGAHDFVRPLTVEGLRRIASEVSNLRAYSVTDWNCHHFVLNIWNEVVIEMLRCSHYPDCVKTGMLRGAIESFGGLVGGGAQLAAQLGIEEHETEVSKGGLFFGSVSSMANEVTTVEEGGSKARIRVLSWQQEGDRIYGELSVPGLQAWAADPSGQISRFTQALRRGSVLLLEPHCKLRVLVEAGGSAGRLARPGTGPGSRLCVDAWARARDWLPGDDGEVAMRLAAQVGLLDEVADSVQRAVVPTFHTGVTPRAASQTGPLTSLFGSTSFGVKDEGQLPDMPGTADDCSIILRGSEVRLAMYVVLGGKQSPPRIGCGGGIPQRRPKQLWLLSGDARAGQEGSFTFVLQDVSIQDLPTSAQSIALKDLESLKLALATGDWGSQHRDAL